MNQPTGGPSVSKARRFASDWADLIIIPVILGFVMGILTSFIQQEIIRNTLLIVMNVAWLLFRDAVFSPGRILKGRKITTSLGVMVGLLGILLSFVFSNHNVALTVVGAVLFSILGIVSLLILIFDKAGYGSNLELVSVSGAKVSILQAAIRNATLAIPFVLLSGYLCEATKVFIPKLLFRKILYVLSFLFVLVFFPGVLESKQLWAILGNALALAVPLFFFIADKNDEPQGIRLMDIYAGTRVIVKN